MEGDKVKRNGLLLVNLGTPDAPTTPAVRRYLREFLSDPRVLDIPAAGRNALLYGVILPFRPKKSAAAYAEIWSDRGSPLLTNLHDLADGVRERLGPEWVVAAGMRYQRPKVSDALDELQAAGADRIVVLPLYPQYASASTGSTLQRVFELASKKTVVPALSVVPDFYEDPGFIKAVADVAREPLAAFKPDHVMFSFHGLPERQVQATDFSQAHCLARANCCDAIVDANRSCYRAQSYATARAAAAALGLDDPESWSVGFQSRLGRTPWIQPYTDELLIRYAKRGVKRLAVLTPSFVADCLETLEEIGIRAKEDFVEAGGDDLLQVPCVNSDPSWMDAVANLARQSLQGRG